MAKGIVDPKKAKKGGKVGGKLATIKGAPPFGGAVATASKATRKKK